MIKHLYHVFSECYKIAGWSGLMSFVKYLFGILKLKDISKKSSVSQDGDIYVQDPAMPGLFSGNLLPCY